MRDNSLLSHLDCQRRQKSQNSITEIASQHTYRDTIPRIKHSRLTDTNTRTLSFKGQHKNRHEQMKGCKTPANPFTPMKNQFPTWNLLRRDTYRPSDKALFASDKTNYHNTCSIQTDLPVWPSEFW